MAKDKRINELPGISASAVLGLNRIGIVSLHDLLTADFDRVAYIVDDFNEAARLVKEAKKQSQGEPTRRTSKSSATEQQAPSPLSPMPSPVTPRGQMRIAGHIQAPRHTPAPGGDTAGSAVLAAALAAAGQGVSLTGSAAEECRATLARRLGVAALMLENNAAEPEILAAMLLEAAEAGAVSPEDVSGRFGAAVEKLVDECTSLRAVPMLPTGKPPRYYMDMAASASPEARRVCAAFLTVACRTGGQGLPGGTWYARLLIEALESGGPDDLVALAREAADSIKRNAA
jgi:hypothetical protein